VSDAAWKQGEYCSNEATAEGCGWLVDALFSSGDISASVFICFYDRLGSFVERAGFVLNLTAATPVIASNDPYPFGRVVVVLMYLSCYLVKEVGHG
jgi:hypothetical protein